MKGPYTPTCCTLLCASFFCFLLAGSEHELLLSGGSASEPKQFQLGSWTKPSAQKVEVSSSDVGANVGDLFSNAMNKEQGNIEC